MTARKSNIVEGVGLLLILLSFLIQLIEADIESEVRETQFYQTQVKLDNLWILESAMYLEKHPESKIHSSTNLDAIEENWKYYSQDKDYLDQWKRGVYYEVISKCRIWIFLLGSILVLVPKFSKIK